MITLCCVWGIVGCKSQQSTEEKTSINFSQISSGTACGIEKAQNLLIRDQETFNNLWEQYGSNQLPPPKVPVIDFSTKYIIAVFMGTKPNGGYRIKITDMKKVGSLLQVNAVQIKPGPSCMSTMALTQPFQMVSIDKMEISDAAFNMSEQVDPCK